DTMDTFVDSSWYYLRFPDNKNDKAIFDIDKTNQWMNVDVYVGGIEHAVLHLLYARFIQKFLHSISMNYYIWNINHIIDYTKHKEPFKKLITQGMVQGETIKDISTNR